MSHVEESVEVRALPEAIWKYLSDLRRIPEYVPNTEEILSVSNGPIGVGTVYRERSLFGPMKSVTEWRITAWDSQRRQKHELVGSSMGVDSIIITITITPSGKDSRLSQVLDYRLTPLLRPFDALFFRGQFRSACKAVITNVKNAVEKQ